MERAVKFGFPRRSCAARQPGSRATKHPRASRRRSRPSTCLKEGTGGGTWSTTKPAPSSSNNHLSSVHRSVLLCERDRSLMSIHTEKPNPRLSTKPVTTPENCYYVGVARRVDGVRSRRTRPRRRRSDGVVHYRNGFASMASRWCHRGAIDAMALVDAEDSKLLTRTQRRRHERTEELSIVKYPVFLTPSTPQWPTPRRPGASRALSAIHRLAPRSGRRFVGCAR